ncbi:MAG: insulinase family protein, partial [Bdellovibrionales bacterium]|nr:insulinase family protein [Bdellovibrionales bacterium]
ANERPGRTGMAHFFEHLMFKGTPKFPNRELDRQIQANGRTNNAFTTRDYTGYYENMPSGKLEIILDIESDRMRNLIFDETEIKNEREVVKEERRYRVENNVYGYLHENVFETVFRVHPYRWPVIGYMRDLNATSVEDLKEFYRVYYAPNNAVLVISGDFKSGQAKSLIEKYYAKIPSQPIPELKFDPEPEQKAQRNSQIVKDVQNPTFSIAYQAPPAGQDEAYAFDLLANILANGSSSRLHKRLVYKQQIANSVSAWAYTPLRAGIFQVICSVKPGADMEKAIGTVYTELWKFRNELVQPDELQKAKTQVMMDYVDSLKTVSGKARAIALNEVLFNDYSIMFKDLDRYNAVTAEQIKEVADKYLKPHQRSIIRVKPKASSSATRNTSTSGEGA